MQRNTISNQHIKALLVTTIIGVGMLSLPSELAMILENDGWIAIILAGLMLIPFLIIIDKLFSMFPNKSIFEIGREVMGPTIFGIILIIQAIYTIIVLAYTVRIFGEVIKVYILETTPIEVIIITMLLATAYLSRSKIEVLGRMAVMIYPIIIGLVVFLLAVTLPDMDYTNIFPIFNADYKQLPRGIMTAVFSYTGYEIIFLCYNYSDDNKNTLKYVLRGLIVVTCVYLIVFFTSLSSFGIYQLKREIWPSVAVVKEVNLPGYFLENLDGIMLAIWVIAIYASLTSIFYIGGAVLSNISKTKTHELFILPLIPIIYTVALLPDNLVQTNEIMARIISYAAIIARVILPIIIFISAIIRKRRSRA
ncbi:endospore germination permease [Schnuerera sp. xch1]|uniref:GerAB/ArcD/ProY family transporter n=1 Tax=Schnuerera sp. xch1 TaxID=2874283 RepID=UPI001CBD061D|nr:endospore germination permease [Schnuerera sp. xch1]MBZ2175090.1 endospore germination permease [Schnuerera sp. xch1]